MDHFIRVVHTFIWAGSRAEILSFHQHHACIYKNSDGEVAEAMKNPMLQCERRVLRERIRFWWGGAALGVRRAVGEIADRTVVLTVHHRGSVVR